MIPVPPQRTRRLTVLGMATAWLVSLISRSPWFDTTAGTLARGLVTLTAFAVLGWLAVRNYRAAQALGDDADPALDERQLAVRNRTYLDAYRIVGAMVVTWAAYLSIASDSRRFWFPSNAYTWLVIFETTLVVAIFTPSVLFTWREPDLATSEDA